MPSGRCSVTFNWFKIALIRCRQGRLQVFLDSIILQIPSTRAGWEYVYNVYSTLGIISAAAAFAAIIYFCVRYRARRNYTLTASDPKTRENRDANIKGPIIIVVLMAIVLITVASQSFVTYNAFSTVPSSPTTIHINVIGHQFAWTFVYPDGYVSEDIAYVPADAIVVFNVTSRDVYHQFGLPYFRVKTDAIPGRFNPVWIQTTDPGNFTVQCFELCGAGHATMIGTLVVENPATFNQWYSSTETSSSASGS
jgi:cytochrome c oxidase subunit 2